VKAISLKAGDGIDNHNEIFLALKKENNARRKGKQNGSWRRLTASKVLANGESGEMKSAGVISRNGEETRHGESNQAKWQRKYHRSENESNKPAMCLKNK
jgi:hypothetical protein